MNQGECVDATGGRGQRETPEAYAATLYHRRMAKQWWNAEDFQRCRRNTISATALIAKQDTLLPKMYIVVWPPFTKGGKGAGRGVLGNLLSAAPYRLAMRAISLSGGTPPALRPGSSGDAPASPLQ